MTEMVGLCSGNYDPNTDSSHTVMRTQFMTLMLALSAAKTFGGSPDQHEKVTKSRASAYSASSGAYDCIPDKVQQIINTVSLTNIMPTLTPYPHLKVTLYRTILHSNSNIALQTCQLLQYHQLTFFNMILVFITANIKTAAHLHPRIAEEYNRWFQVYENLNEIYGNDWKYYKLFNPNGIETATTLWPTLAACALFYNMSLGSGAGSLKNLKSSKLNFLFPIQKLLSTPLKEEYHLNMVGSKSALEKMSNEAAEFLQIQRDFLLTVSPTKWFKSLDDKLFILLI